MSDIFALRPWGAATNLRSRFSVENDGAFLGAYVDIDCFLVRRELVVIIKIVMDVLNRGMMFKVEKLRKNCENPLFFNLTNEGRSGLELWRIFISH